MLKDVAIALFYIMITVVVFVFSNKLYLRFKLAFLNQVFISSITIVLLLTLFKIPYSVYNLGGSVISRLLGPLVVVLAIPLYKNRLDLKKNFIPIILGAAVGVLSSFITIIFLCKVFKIDNLIFLSLVPKSITTPMALEAVKLLGGDGAITIFSVVVTGITGAGVAPLIVKYGRIKNDIAKGIGIGTSAHALGTSKAVEMGEEIGAASGLSIAVTGIITIIGIIVFN